MRRAPSLSRDNAVSIAVAARLPTRLPQRCQRAYGSSCPPTTRRPIWSASCGRSPPSSTRPAGRLPDPRRRRQLARRHRPDRRSPGRRARGRGGPASQRQTGLGSAYRAGFGHALARGAELLIEMDADFSHDPRYLPALLAAAAGRRPRARIALRAGRRGPRLGAAAPDDQPRRGHLRARDPRCRASTI